MEQAASGLKRKLVLWALGGRASGTRAIASRASASPPRLELLYRLATVLVFSKLHKKLGGRLRYAISGGAPLAPEIADFLNAIGLTVFEGYGLSETAPVLAANRPGKMKVGTVGVAWPGVEIKIAPEPDRDRDGEIVVRGPNIMLGYYNKPEATAEVLDADGWLRTGDIGYIDERGFPAHHRSQEGAHQDGRRQVRRPAAHREPAQDPPAHRAGRRHRRQAPVLRGPAGAQVRRPGEGARQAAARGPQRAQRRPAGAQPAPAGIDRVNQDLGSWEQIKRFALLAGRAHPGERRAHSDPEDQAPRGRAEVPGADRLALPSVVGPGDTGRPQPRHCANDIAFDGSPRPCGPGRLAVGEAKWLSSCDPVDSAPRRPRAGTSSTSRRSTRSGRQSQPRCPSPGATSSRASSSPCARAPAWPPRTAARPVAGGQPDLRLPQPGPPSRPARPARRQPARATRRSSSTAFGLDRGRPRRASSTPATWPAGRGARRSREIIGILRDTYCRTVGVEYLHIQDTADPPLAAERRWSRCATGRAFDREKQLDILELLIDAELFETFLHSRYPGQKRFSLEGAETLIPALHAIVELGARARRRGDRARHGPPRPAQRARQHPRQVLRDDLLRVRGQHRPRDGRRRRRREVPPRLQLRPPQRAGHARPPEPHLQPEPPRGRRPGGRGARARQAAPPRRHRAARKVAAAADPRRRRLRRPGAGGRDAQPLAARGLPHRRHDPHRRQQPDRLHHLAQRGALDALLHRRGQDDRGARSSTSTATTPRRWSTSPSWRSSSARSSAATWSSTWSATAATATTRATSPPSPSRCCTARSRTAPVGARSSTPRSCVEAGDARRRGGQAHRRRVPGASCSEAFEEVHSGAAGARAAAPAVPGAWAGPRRSPTRTSRSTTGVPLEALLRGRAAPLHACPRASTSTPRSRASCPSGCAGGRAAAAPSTGRSPRRWPSARCSLEGTPVRLSGPGQRAAAPSPSATPSGTTCRPRQPLHAAQPPRGRAGAASASTTACSPRRRCSASTTATRSTSRTCSILWEAQFGDFANGAQVIIDQFIVARPRPSGSASSGLVHAPAARLRGAGARALQRLPRALPRSLRRGQHPGRATSPRRRSTSTLLRRQVQAALPQAAGRDGAQEPAAAPARRLAGRASSWPGRFREVLDDPAAARARPRRAGALQRQGLLRPRRERARRAGIDDVALVRVEQLYPFCAGERCARSLARYPAARELVWAQEEPQNRGRLDLHARALAAGAAARACRSATSAAPRSASPATGSLRDAHEQPSSEAASSQRGPRSCRVEPVARAGKERVAMLVDDQGPGGRRVDHRGRAGRVAQGRTATLVRARRAALRAGDRQDHHDRRRPRPRAGCSILVAGRQHGADRPGRRHASTRPASAAAAGRRPRRRPARRRPAGPGRGQAAGRAPAAPTSRRRCAGWSRSTGSTPAQIAGQRQGRPGHQGATCCATSSEPARRAGGRRQPPPARRPRRAAAPPARRRAAGRARPRAARGAPSARPAAA